MIGDYRGFGMDDERSSKHGESPWICPTCGCPRSVSKRLEQQKPRVKILGKCDAVIIKLPPQADTYVEKREKMEVTGNFIYGVEVEE